MDHRYSLRFETGERAGETIPIQGASFTVGRRTGHSLQILDNSVSGRHAEIVVDDAGVILRDLGSTNGTRVGSERILETRLSNGARILFGNVQVVFQDSGVPMTSAGASAGMDAGAVSRPTSAATSVASPPASALAATTMTAVPAGDSLLRVSPEILARSRKRSIAGIVGLVLLVAGSGSLWFLLRRSSPSGESAVRPARPAADNLLGEDFSFEGDTDGWKAAEGAPAAFLEGSTGRASGTVAVSADLGADSYALHGSREVRAAPGTSLEASAVMEADGDAVARLGVELSAPEGDQATGTVVAWSAPRNEAEGSGEARVSLVVPPGYETARVLLLGRAERGGSVAVDDVSLAVRGTGVAPPVSVGDWQLALIGDPPGSAVLARFGRTHLSGIAFALGCAIPESAEAGAIAAVAEKRGIVLSTSGRSSLCLRAEPALVHASLATIGAEGYATHGPDFEREGVTSVLVGKGGDLVRLAFASPVRVTGTAEGSASRILARAAGGAEIAEVVLQLDFTEERREAGGLAFKARNAEKKGELGECLRLWSELLNGFPYEEQLVAEAEGKRGALVQQGLSELAAVRAETERARFFRLVDLYRQCRQKALAVSARYQGSEVDEEARKVVQEVETELSGLEADLARTERGRVESILAALEAQKAAGLAAAVREHLSARPAEARR